jgi:hypothetical protein
MRAFIMGLVERAESPGVIEEKLEIIRRDSVPPHSGHSAGSSAVPIERINSNCSSQPEHLYS